MQRLWRLEEDVRSFGTGVTVVSLHVGAGNPIWALRTATSIFNHGVISPAHTRSVEIEAGFVNSQGQGESPG